MSSLTDYEHRGDDGSHWTRLLFDGDEEKYEIYETKFLGHLRSLGLKDAILGANLTREDNERNEEAYAELVQFLEDKSLLSMIKEAADNGRKALNILRGQ